MSDSLESRSRSGLEQSSLGFCSSDHSGLCFPPLARADRIGFAQEYKNALFVRHYHVRMPITTDFTDSQENARTRLFCFITPER